MKEQIDAMIVIFFISLAIVITSGISIYFGLNSNVYPAKTFFTLLAAIMAILFWVML